jgi:hypothetical protein
MKRSIYRTIRRWLRDRLEYPRRVYPHKLSGAPEIGLEPTQIYPIGNNIRVAIQLALQKNFSDLTLTDATATASIGTCFAEEFSMYIKNSNGNYLYKEPNVWYSSASWGRVYTIPNLHQIIDYSIKDDFPSLIESCNRGFFDPCRERSIGYFSSIEEASRKILAHRLASKAVFRDAEVLVVTLGQNEAWKDSENQIVWGGAPPSDLLKLYPTRFKPIEFSYQENLERLEAAFSSLFSFNSSLKVIVTLSPVAAWATFLSDDVVTQSFAGKCLLRSVIHDVSKKFKNQVYYFPSFEIVFCDNPSKFRADNRHVKYGTVDKIFSVLAEVTR